MTNTIVAPDTTDMIWHGIKAAAPNALNRDLLLAFAVIACAGLLVITLKRFDAAAKTTAKGTAHQRPSRPAFKEPTPPPADKGP